MCGQRSRATITIAWTYCKDIPCPFSITWYIAWSSRAVFLNVETSASKKKKKKERKERKKGLSDIVLPSSLEEVQNKIIGPLMPENLHQMYGCVGSKNLCRFISHIWSVCVLQQPPKLMCWYPESEPERCSVESAASPVLFWPYYNKGQQKSCCSPKAKLWMCTFVCSKWIKHFLILFLTGMGKKISSSLSADHLPVAMYIVV